MNFSLRTELIMIPISKLSYVVLGKRILLFKRLDIDKRKLLTFGQRVMRSIAILFLKSFW